MIDIKYYPVVMVGEDITVKRYLKEYFKYIITIKKEKILDILSNRNYSILFLINNIDIVKKIREYYFNKEIIIVLLSKSITKSQLIELISLKVLDYTPLPINRDNIKKIFDKIYKEFYFKNFNNIFHLKDGYIFNSLEQKLFDNKNVEIKLTKKEKKLMTILVKSENQFIKTESFEYHIWEEESMKYNCQNRFKVLLSNLRKKLPKNTIINSYGLGYKIVLERLPMYDNI